MDEAERNPWIDEGDAAYTSGRLEEAMRAYRAALAEDSDIAWAHSRIGAILAQQGDLDGAESALLRAAELDPSLPQAHSNLGNVYFARGQYEEALRKYKEAVALSPNNPVFQENLHAAYKKLGKLSEAVAALKQAHRLQRDSAKTEAKERLQASQQRIKRRMGCLTTLSLLVILPLILALMFA